MEITNIKLKRFNDKNSKLLGVASIQLDNSLIIHDLKLIQIDENKRIISFPNKKIEYKELNEEKDGYNTKVGYSDIVHPCTLELRQYIEESIYKLYDSEKEIDNE